MRYVLTYPPAHSDTYVKATTVRASANRLPYDCTDPASSLTGGDTNNEWHSEFGVVTGQRFHIDLGSAKKVRGIYYENAHNSGADTDRGAKTFTFWGSNTGSGSFDDLVYANDEGWTQILCSESVFDEHVALDQADPKYIYAGAHVAYRYYAFKFADNYTNATYMALRRIVLMTLTAQHVVMF